MLNLSRSFLARQTPASALVVLTGIYAAALSVMELAAAIDLRVLTGVMLHAGATTDPLFEAGTSLGFYATLFFVLNFILATRWRWVERLFGGLDRIYGLHALSGKIALSFVLLHTAILVMQAMPNWSTVAAYIVPGVDIAYTLGLEGTLGLLVLVVLTIWVRLPYEAWLTTHKLMIIPFLGGTLHAIVLQLDWYMILVTTIGLIAWTYAVFVYPSRGKGTHATVIQAATHADIRELTLRPDQTVGARPGQFAFLSLAGGAGSGQRHPFSISGLDADGHIRLSVRRAGDFTAGLLGLAVGTRVRLHGPYGSFGYRVSKARGEQVWLAGGIGITPFLSLLQALSAFGSTLPLHLVWSVRTEDQAVYRDEIERLMTRLPEGRFTLHVSSASGRLSGTDLSETGDKKTTYCLCGPSEMMTTIEAQLLDRGVPARHIVSEHFAMR